MMVNCTQRIFLASPDDKPKIISSDAYAGNAYYNAENVLTRTEDDLAGTMWVIPEGGQGEFIMDMGSVVLLLGVELVNTVNRDQGRDRATRAFKVHLALAYSGPWTEVLSEELQNPLQDPLPLPLLTFTFPPTQARFIRFKIVSWYGRSGALQYFFPLFPFLGQLHCRYIVDKCSTIRQMFVCLHSLSHVAEGGRTIETCSSRGDPVLYKEVDPALGLTVAAEDTIKHVQTTSLVG